MTPEERQELIDAIDAGNAGNLTIGKILHARISRGANRQTLEAWLRNQGRKLPDPPTQTKFIKAYETWVLNANMEIGEVYQDTSYTDDAGNPISMTLTGVSTYALYEARNIINRDNPVETLALVYNSTIDEIKDMARDKNEEREPREALRSLPKVPASTLERLKVLEGEVFDGLSRQEILAFLFEFMLDLYEMKPNIIRNAVETYLGRNEE